VTSATAGAAGVVFFQVDIAGLGAYTVTVQ